jgi:REP element-mobilizing transposase RayT
MKKMQGAKIMQDVKIMQGAKKIQRTKNIQRAIHVYQMTVGKVVIFYTLQDFLVFYTIFSTYARKHGMTILGLALMYNHIHVLIAADSRTEIRSFVSGYSSRFVRDYNADAGRKGPLFNMQFGSAVKYGAKSIRTAAGYLYNNHTNKKLCGKAQNSVKSFIFV